MGVSFHVTDNSKDAISAMKSQVKQAMEACGKEMEANAKNRVHVRTGALRNSIEYEAGDDYAAVGSDLDYALTEEMRDGGGHDFIKPAVSEHVSDYENIIKSALEK